MITPASISPPRPAPSLKGPAVPRNSCPPTLQISTPLSTGGFPSNNASGNTCPSTAEICIRRLTPCSNRNRHLSGKDYIVTTNLFLALSRGCHLSGHVACCDYLKRR